MRAVDRALFFCGLVFALVGGLFTAIGLGMAPVLLHESLVFLVFPVLGLVFLGLGIGLLVRRARLRRLHADLLQNGQCIWADIIAVEYNWQYEVNGRHPLVVRCQAVNPADGKVYVFTSEGIWFDPTPWLENRRQVPVYVDPDDYWQYVVDLDGILPEQG